LPSPPTGKSARSTFIYSHLQNIWKKGRGISVTLPRTHMRDHLGDFEHVVLLAVVRLGDSAYGVTIRQEIERRIGRAVSIGQIYSALNRLENKGFISSMVSDPTPVRGGRAKRYFKAEPLGVDVLRRARTVLSLMWEGLDPQTL